MASTSPVSAATPWTCAMVQGAKVFGSSVSVAVGDLDELVAPLEQSFVVVAVLEVGFVVGG